MARLFGKLGWYGQCSCCNCKRDKRAVKAIEEREWRGDWEDERDGDPSR